MHSFPRNEHRNVWINLPTLLNSNLWSWDLGNDRKDEIAITGILNETPTGPHILSGPGTPWDAPWDEGCGWGEGYQGCVAQSVATVTQISAGWHTRQAEYIVMWQHDILLAFNHRDERYNFCWQDLLTCTCSNTPTPTQPQAFSLFWALLFLDEQG